MPTGPFLPDIAPDQGEIPEREASLWRDAWRRLAKNRLALAGLWILVGLILICVCGPLVAFLPQGLRPSGLSYSYAQQDLHLHVSPPGAKHWLGTDQLGRDVLARVMFGGRISLLVGLSATAVALTIGLLYGAVSGYFGGKLDIVMMRT